MADIGIVGGGIAGLYCAWKLSDNKSHSVTLYECLNRLGGRIETRDLKGFKAECGPMRFEVNIEPLFEKLAGKLGINFGEFSRTGSGSAEFPKHDLQPNEMSNNQRAAIAAIENLQSGSVTRAVAGVFSHHTSALDLLKFGIYRIFNPHDQNLSLADVVSGGKGSRISQFAVSAENLGGLKDYRFIRTKQTLDGVHLHNLGFWNALSRVLSPGAVAKIRDTGTFYHLMPENPSASEWAIFWLRLSRPDADLFRIKEGVETVIERIEKNLRDKGITPEVTKTVEGVAAGIGGKVLLKIAGDPIPKEFDHVILAIPAVPLHVLAENFPRDIKTYVSGVIPFPLLKTFVVIKDPWWGELPEPQQGAHLVPTREIHYFPPDDGSRDKAMIMLYTDRPATAYWHPHVEGIHTGAQIGTTQELKHDLALQVARLLPRGHADEESHAERVEESILDFAIRDWSEPPFSAACHAWRPHIHVPAALDRLKAFRLEGAHGDNNVHICGEAYSDYQGFIEGALRSASNVLEIL